MTEVATGGAATSAGGEPPDARGAGAWDAQRPPSRSETPPR